MIPFAPDLDPWMAALADAHHVYVNTVSSAAWAISLQTAAAAIWYCHHTHPATLCDLGSGFTSYALRTYGRTTSVDTDPEWLAATRRFLDDNNLDTDRTVTFDEWRAGTDGYDLIVHDLSQGDVREDAMWDAVRRLNPNGLVIFDDAHHDSHQAQMRAVCDETGLSFHLLAATLDNLGRFAAVAW